MSTIDELVKRNSAKQTEKKSVPKEAGKKVVSKAKVKDETVSKAKVKDETVSKPVTTNDKAITSGNSENKVDPVTFSHAYRSMRYTIIPDSYHVMPDSTRQFVPGKHVVFENGQFTTDDPLVIDFLRKQDDYNKKLTEI